MRITIQVRRGTSAEWAAADPVLYDGEIGYNTTTNKVKVGDGVKKWSELDYLVADSSVDIHRCKTVAVIAGSQSVNFSSALTGAIVTLAKVVDVDGVVYDVLGQVSNIDNDGFDLDSPVAGNLTYMAIKEQ